MDKYTKSFFTLIERHEENVFAKPAFEIFNHECKSKHKFTFEGQKQGVAFYRAKIKELNEFGLVFTKALIEAQVSTEGKKAAFQLLLQTTGMEIESHDIGTVEENEKGKLVFRAYGTQPAPVMVAVKITDQE